MPAPGTPPHVLLPPSTATPVPASAAGVPWFYGYGEFTGENHDLRIDWLMAGSYAVVATYVGLYPTIDGLWQVTFAWERYNDGSEVSGGLQAHLAGAASIIPSVTRVFPYADNQHQHNAVTTTIGAGFGVNNLVRASLSSAPDGARGWLIGHLITEIELPSEG